MSELEAGRELDAMIQRVVFGSEMGEPDWPCGYQPDGCDLELWPDYSERFEDDTDETYRKRQEFWEDAKSHYPERHPVYFRRHDNGWKQRLVVPHYSVSISAAWEIVENMARRGYALHLAAYRHESPPPDEAHRAAFWCKGDMPRTAYAPTSPLVICKAALLALEASSPLLGSVTPEHGQ